MRLIHVVIPLVWVICPDQVFVADNIVYSDSEATSGHECKIVVYTGDIVHPKFGGVGFHVSHHMHPTTKNHFEQVIAKRWREMNPSFARMTHKWDWDQAMMDKVAEHLAMLKNTGTEVYMATWGPKDTEEGEQRITYAKKVVDTLEYLLRKKGAGNIKYYCMTNELTMTSWGKLKDDLPKFRDYHQKIFDEIQARGLDIRLLASDAAPIRYWHTIEWAGQNMDGITGVYGGHHYINGYDLEDAAFYPWFLSQMIWGADLARQRGKNFILGEFGCRQNDQVIIDGLRRDTCVYWDTPREPLVGIQLAEAVIAALNGGIYALCNWTFTDFPDPPARKRVTYLNKWGTFKWSGSDYSPRAHYFAYGLLTKFFRGPATVFKVESNDELVRAAALRHHHKRTYSIALVNRRKDDVPIRIRMDGDSPTKAFRKYVYDPKDVPWHPFGDLQEPVGKIPMEDRFLVDTVGKGTLTVYTTAYDEQPPATVRLTRVERDSEGKCKIKWQPNMEPDFCYYRIYRSKDVSFVPSPKTRIGSTTVTEFLDESAKVGQEDHYKIVAVDQSGNASDGG